MPGDEAELEQTGFKDVPPELQLRILILAAGLNTSASIAHHDHHQVSQGHHAASSPPLVTTSSSVQQQSAAASGAIPQPFLVSKHWRSLLQPASAMAAWACAWCGAQHGLVRAARAGQHAVCVQLLARHRAEAGAWGSTALWLAARRGCLEVCELLLRNGASAAAAFSKPLLMAVDGGQLAVCKLLLAHGADPCAQGGAILQLAAARGQGEVHALLLAHTTQQPAPSSGG